MKRFLMGSLLLAVCLMFGTTARAWNCSDPLASRVDVGPTKPAGSAGDADGQYYKGSDASNPNDYYVCQVPKPPTVTPPSQNQTQSQNQSASANSSANAGAVATGGNATAKGGTVKNSGNSSNANTNTNTATGGAGGNASQTQSSNSAALDNGNNSNNYSNSTRVDAAAASAFAQASTSAPCFKGYGAGGQTIMGGISLSGGRVDQNCDIRATSLLFASFGADVAACKIAIREKNAKKAGVTLEDCLNSHKQVAISTAVATQAPQPVQVQVQLVPAPVVAPEPHVSVVTTGSVDLPSFKLVNGVLTNVGKRHLDDVVVRLVNNPGSRLTLTGPWEAAQAVAYLHSRGVDDSRIDQHFSDDMNSTVSLKIEWTESVQGN